MAGVYRLATALRAMLKSSLTRLAGASQTRGNRPVLNRRICIVAVALAVLFSFTSPAWAWGPATHVKLAADVLSNLWLLPAAIGAIISRHRKHFTYGNVATDTVLAKKMSKTKQICHRWQTGFSLLDEAGTDAGKAFAYGYLAHLAADTVAHNKFLPHQMAVSRSTITFGHLYWEVRADSLIDRRQWHALRHILKGAYPEPERLLRHHLTDTMLSFDTNRYIFKRMNLIASLDGWRRSVEFWSKLSRFTLNKSVLHGYHDESIARIADVLCHGRQSVVLHEDPNGNMALAYARAQRRQLRQMRRAGIPHSHVIREAAAGHAPVSRRAAGL